jgi:CTP:molybdopterin cytidylyltransferase MocA
MSVAAILLAAGRSRRMGAFKPLLPFGSVTVAQCCVSYLLEGGAEHVVVVVGHRREEVRAALKHLPVSFAVNPAPESEMGESIASGVLELPDETEAILIALVDQPAIPPSVPRALIDEWRRTGARLLVPEHGGRGGHPVLVDGSLRRELLHLDAQGGLRALFDKHRPETRRVSVASPYIARDMDTWDDYRALYEEVFRAPAPQGETG